MTTSTWDVNEASPFVSYTCATGDSLCWPRYSKTKAEGWSDLIENWWPITSQLGGIGVKGPIRAFVLILSPRIRASLVSHGMAPA